MIRLFSLPIVLDSCIYINQERISRRHIIPNGVRFYLNKENIILIQQAQANKHKIKLPPRLLADFRYYILVERQSYIQSEITFSTYYQQNTQEIAKVKSTISLEGKIYQQICHDGGKNPQLLLVIVNAHYWLIGQMFSQLPLKRSSFSKWLPWYISLGLTILIAPVFFYLPNFSFIIKLIIIILLVLFLKECSQRFWIGYLRRWILSQLLFGIFSYRSKNRKVGFDLLAMFS